MKLTKNTTINISVNSKFAIKKIKEVNNHIKILTRTVRKLTLYSLIKVWIAFKLNKLSLNIMILSKKLNK